MNLSFTSTFKQVQETGKKYLNLILQTFCELDLRDDYLYQNLKEKNQKMRHQVERDKQKFSQIAIYFCGRKFINDTQINNFEDLHRKESEIVFTNVIRVIKQYLQIKSKQKENSYLFCHEFSLFEIENSFNKENQQSIIGQKTKKSQFQLFNSLYNDYQKFQHLGSNKDLAQSNKNSFDQHEIIQLIYQNVHIILNLIFQYNILDILESEHQQNQISQNKKQIKKYEIEKQQYTNKQRKKNSQIFNPSQTLRGFCRQTNLQQPQFTRKVICKNKIFEITVTIKDKQKISNEILKIKATSYSWKSAIQQASSQAIYFIFNKSIKVNGKNLQQIIDMNTIFV